jgi:predicted glycoside hydrolase/deacetylase ChbG (UPF0249 family)
MKAIINADDFGIHNEANRAITKCFQDGIINRTTIMVNKPYTDEAVEMAIRGGFFNQVGLHLNLSSGTPLSAECFDSDLCENGVMTRSWAKKPFISENTRKAIRSEIKAQMQKYVDYGFTLMHIDSHRHMHTKGAVIKILKPLLEEYGFTSIRISRNIPPKAISFVKAILKKRFNDGLRKLDMQTTDYFGSKKDFEAWTQRSGVVEIMVHPKFTDAGIIADDKDKMLDTKWLADQGIELLILK